jgi:hypothetical protein
MKRSTFLIARILLLLGITGTAAELKPMHDLTAPSSGDEKRADRVWEVRVVHLEGAPTGVLWVHDKTQKVIALGLP